MKEDSLTSERDPDLVNPDWERKDDWPFEEDWQSPKWKRRDKRTWRKIQIGRDLYGFATCPECRTDHTALTITCRGCGYQVPISDEQKAAVEKQLTEELGDGAEFGPHTFRRGGYKLQS